MGQACQKRNSSDDGVAPKSAAASSKPPTAAKPPPDGKIEGKSGEEWKALGNEAVKKGDHNSAYAAYSKGIRADPQAALNYSNRALCLEKLGRIQEAVDDAMWCISLKPDFTKAYLRAATGLQQLKRPHEALEILAKAPDSQDVESLRAQLKVQADKAPKPRSAPVGSAERLKEEGNALFKKGFFEKALETYEKALKACSDDPQGETAIAICNNRAGCYQQLSDFHAVVRETNFVLEQQPDNLKARIRRMMALEPLEKYEEALADARKVIAAAPGNEVANKVQHRLGKLVRDRARNGSEAKA